MNAGQNGLLILDVQKVADDTVLFLEKKKALIARKMREGYRNPNQFVHRTPPFDALDCEIVQITCQPRASMTSSAALKSHADAQRPGGAVKKSGPKFPAISEATGGRVSFDYRWKRAPGFYSPPPRGGFSPSHRGRGAAVERERGRIATDGSGAAPP